LEPEIIKGGIHSDDRGVLLYNNDFNASDIKRIYFIENKDTEVARAWQGHKIEQRWFSVTNGSFLIKTIKIDNWDKPSSDLTCMEFVISSKTLDILYVPKGYITSIQALENESKILAMADYRLGEIQDEFRFETNYFQ